MASISNPLNSSNLFVIKFSLYPSTPKTTKSPANSLPFFSNRKFLVTRNALNREPNSKLSKSIPSQAALATLLFSSIAPQALAVDNANPPPTPPPVIQAQPNQSSSSPFSQNVLLTAPQTQSKPASDLPEGSQWRYSEFLNAVKKGKVERVKFTKDGSVLQLSAVDGRRATVIVPNDPDLIDILAMNGVDISVSEGDSGNGLFNFIGNLLFPFLAFAGLFL